ncbi:Uncharacterized protein TSPI_08632 [Trichinella spiralis]|uniref:Uncharacterized protein n=1 Tax=Trichinella spiralis TaxID=6334 RepID=A0ABR3KIY6_TRISP
MEKPWMRIFQASTSPCTGSLAAFAVRPRRPRCPVGCFHLKFASTSLWSSVGVSAMDVVMVDDGVVMSLLTVFVMSRTEQSGLGVAEGGPVRCGARTFGRFVVRLGFSILDSEDFFKAAMFRSSSELTELGITEFWKFAWLRLQVVAIAPMTTYHTTSSHPNSLLILAYTPVGPCSPNRSVHLKIHKASSLFH